MRALRTLSEGTKSSTLSQLLRNVYILAEYVTYLHAKHLSLYSTARSQHSGAFISYKAHLKAKGFSINRNDCLILQR
jgi:hypothetical protein